MPRYIAKRPIHIGGALAFAAGAQVPAGHVERFDLLHGGLDGPGVIEVGDDVVGDRPDLADGVADTTPPTVSIGHRLLYGDPDIASTSAEASATGAGDSPDAPADVNTPPPPKTAGTTTTKTKPAAGSTTSTVTEG